MLQLHATSPACTIIFFVEVLETESPLFFIKCVLELISEAHRQRGRYASAPVAQGAYLRERVRKCREVRVKLEASG